MQSSKNVLSLLNSSFEIYTRYSDLDDEKQKQSISCF